MSEILTTEQVAAIKLTLPLTPWSHSNRVTLYQLCAATETLRVRLAKAEQQLADEQVQWSDTCTGWALAMEQMEADVRALAEAINIQGCNCGARAESPKTHPHVSGCPTGFAMARRGVQRLLAPKEVNRASS